MYLLEHVYWLIYYMFYYVYHYGARRCDFIFQSVDSIRHEIYTCTYCFIYWNKIVVVIFVIYFNIYYIYIGILFAGCYDKYIYI